MSFQRIETELLFIPGTRILEFSTEQHRENREFAEMRIVDEAGSHRKLRGQGRSPHCGEPRSQHPFAGTAFGWKSLCRLAGLPPVRDSQSTPAPETGEQSSQVPNRLVELALTTLYGAHQANLMCRII